MNIKLARIAYLYSSIFHTFEIVNAIAIQCQNFIVYVVFFDLSSSIVGMSCIFWLGKFKTPEHSTSFIAGLTKKRWFKVRPTLGQHIVFAFMLWHAAYYQ